MEFEVLVSCPFQCFDSESLDPIDKKHLLSLINEYEDGEWMYDKFQNFIWDNIAETALSDQERNALVDKSHSLLTQSAKKLRLTDSSDDISEGSEIAEIFLYGIMKDYYGALPVVPKIFYKQNPKDNAKGADSVHIVLEGEDDFTLWFGEAKFYNSIEDKRLYTILNSVKNSLDTAKLKKENSIICNLQDIDSLVKNKELLGKIKEALANKNSIDYLKPKIHIPILLIHECEVTKNNKSLTNEMKAEIMDYHKERAQSYYKKQINKCKDVFDYSKITFHLILFPVPDKSPIIDTFLANAKHFAG